MAALSVPALETMRERELLTENRQSLATLEREANAFGSLPPEPPIAGRLDFWENECGRQHRRELMEPETER